MRSSTGFHFSISSGALHFSAFARSLASLAVSALIILLSGCRSTHDPSAQSEKAASELNQVLESGLATRDLLNTMTYEDVPSKWRTKIEEESTDRYFRKLYFRGNDKILEVLWSKDWTGEKSNMFTAAVYDGNARIGRIIRFSNGGTSVAQPKSKRADYEAITSIGDDGRASVTFMSEEGYFQKIEIDGRNTRLEDDLEYMKGAVMIEQVAKPLAESINSQVERSEKAQDQTGNNSRKR